jgi:hypothetical protein
MAKNLHNFLLLAGLNAAQVAGERINSGYRGRKKGLVALQLNVEQKVLNKTRVQR